MGICVSCRRRERKAPEKRLRAVLGPSKGATAELLPRRASPDHLAAMANSISNIKMVANPIKTVVSKRKKRYVQDGFNLDLSYITDRMIAMGYPAHRLEGVYRNHIDEVYRFLELKHQDHYKIYNLCSERSYDYNKFHERVATYPFNDHSPPTMELIQPFCTDVHEWLSLHPENVAAVHCKAGKGRTGTMICCYLLYSGQKETPEEALDFYGILRTYDEKGVTIPSQRRYVQYYSAMLRNGLQYNMQTLHFRHVRIECFPPSISQSALELIIQPLGYPEAFKYKMPPEKPDKSPPKYSIISTEIPAPPRDSLAGDEEEKPGGLRLAVSACVPLAGDVKVEVIIRHLIGRKERLFHFWFNTFFITQQICATRVMDVREVMVITDKTTLEDELKLYDCGPDVETYKMNFEKFELDDAHKDKQHKLYSPDFKVEMVVQRPPASSPWATRPPPAPPAPPPRPSPPTPRSPSPPWPASPASSNNDEDSDNDVWDSGNKKSEKFYWDNREKDPLFPKELPNNRQIPFLKQWTPNVPKRYITTGTQYPCDMHQPYSLNCCSKDDASISSNITLMTDISHSSEKEVKILKVSSDHMISSIDPVYDTRQLESPNESNKKKNMFFQSGKKDLDEKKELPSNMGKPRLSLGDMKATWKEFSEKHFGTDTSKEKKKKDPNSFHKET